VKLKEIILEQRREMEEIFGREKIVERKAKSSVLPFLKYPNILAILGVRRCGKSILAFQLFSGEKFGYINFDDERLLGTKAEDLNRILQILYELYGKELQNIVIDEPQNVEGWELFVSRLRRTKKVVVTGSNSKLLAGELATHLTGRYIDIELYPFSFQEFLDFHGVPASAETTAERGEIMRLLREYITWGGFPEFFKFGRSILRRIYDDIIVKDVVRRCGIKKEEGIRKIALFLVSDFSREFTYSSLKSIGGAEHLSTISKWVAALEEAYLIRKLERFSFRLKEAVIAPKKVYCVDTGLINAVGLRTSEDFGRLMENVVATELFRRSGCHEEFEVFYWKDHQGREVDFVIKSGTSIRQLIQVSYVSAQDEIDRRELKGLVEASAQLKCDTLLLITWDYEGEIQHDGKQIRCLPLWKWLLSS